MPTISKWEVSPAAHLFRPNRKEQRQIVFQEKSQKVKCPHCDCVSHSIVAYQANFLGYLLMVLGILIFGVLSIFLAPFLMGLTKQAVHKCAKCLNDVKQASLLGLDNLEDKVLATNIGNFGVIITRKYMLYLAMIVSAILSIYMFVLTEQEMALHPTISNLSWEGY